jgi:hypothetical protein
MLIYSKFFLKSLELFEYAFSIASSIATKMYAILIKMRREIRLNDPQATYEIMWCQFLPNIGKYNELEINYVYS